VFDWLTIGGITWSYQPSESSAAMMTAMCAIRAAAEAVQRVDNERLLVERIELPGCPFW
jgi:hypothetical protein